MRRLSKQLIDNHITPLFREFPQLEKFYTKTDKCLRLPNKSEVVFGYAEHPAQNMQGDIYDYQGSEWATIGIDQAEAFNEEELTFIKGRCRWPGVKGKLLLTFNPGGRGHNYLKRVFIDRDLEPNEHTEDIAFVQAFGWDNAEWPAAWLESQGLTRDDYYSNFTDAERKIIFLTHSDYGHNLDGYKGKMRLAYLEGDWLAFAGQFFDIWDRDEVTSEIPKLEAWWPRWISIDWGYEHNAAVYWHCQAKNITITYRELVGQHIAPTELGETVAKMSEGEDVDAVYLSPDAFELSRRKWQGKDMISDLIGAPLRQAKLPWPCRADNDRIGGARLMHELLTAGLWKIDESCVRLLKCLPELQRDDDNREDVLKVDADDMGEGGDDPYDSARYGLKSRGKTPPPPIEVRVKNRIQEYATGRGLRIEDLEPTSRAMMTRRALRLERPKAPPQSFRPGRPYHGGA